MLVYGEAKGFYEVENPYREVWGVTNLFGTLFNVSNSKVGKVGLLYLPSNISDKQRESLGRLSSLLKDYRVEVNYNLRVDDGVVDSDRHTMIGISKVSNKIHNKKKA